MTTSYLPETLSIDRLSSLLGITADEEYGGLSMGYQAHCIVLEELSRASGLHHPIDATISEKTFELTSSKLASAYPTRPTPSCASTSSP